MGLWVDLPAHILWTAYGPQIYPQHKSQSLLTRYACPNFIFSFKKAPTQNTSD